MTKEFYFDGRMYSESEMSKILKPNSNAVIDRRFLKTFAMIEGPKVLDLGCNAGAWSYKMAEEKGFYVTGVDIVPEFIDIAKHFFEHPRINFFCMDFLSGNLPDGEYDCVIFLETIEHVENPMQFLKEIFRVLKPGGCLIISTPNAISEYGIFKQLTLLTKRAQVKTFHIIENEKRNTGTQTDHIYNWDFTSFYRLLNRAGYVYENHEFTISRIINTKLMEKLFSPFCMSQIFKVRKPKS